MEEEKKADGYVPDIAALLASEPNEGPVTEPPLKLIVPPADLNIHWQGVLIDVAAQRDYYQNVVIVAKETQKNPAPLWKDATDAVKENFRKSAMIVLAETPGMFDHLANKVLRSATRVIENILNLLPTCPLCRREQGKHEVDCPVYGTILATEGLREYIKLGEERDKASTQQ